MKKAVVVVLTGLIIIVWYFALFGERGIIKIIHLHHERDRILAEVQRIQEKNEKLKREIRLMHEDPSYLESVARKELGVVKENEILFIFEDDEVEKKWDKD